MLSKLYFVVCIDFHVYCVDLTSRRQFTFVLEEFGLNGFPLIIIPQTRVGYELLDSGRESAIISSYPTSVGGIVFLLDFKCWIKISRILFSTDSSFRPF